MTRRVGVAVLAAAMIVPAGCDDRWGSLPLPPPPRTPPPLASVKFVGEAARDQAGQPVSGAGDVNGDGFDDLIVGAELNDAGGPNAGAAYLVYGSPTRLSGSVDLSTADAKFVGEEMTDYAGASVAGAGDVNGDGFDDLIVGARMNDAAATNAGAAYLIYGSAGGPSGTIDLSAADAKFVGEEAGDEAGISVSGAGDVNGDGFDDLIVGAFGHGVGGAAYLIYGSSGGPVGEIDLSAADAKFLGEGPADSAGWSVSGAGDVNGDGFDDLIIGAFCNSSGHFRNGAVYLIYGSAIGPSGTIDLSAADAKFTGEWIEDYAGRRVSRAGDVNNDGFDEIVVGAYLNDAGGTDSGAAYLFYGSPSGLYGTIDLSTADAKFVGEEPGDGAGLPVAGAGDLNGDGFGDLVVCAVANDGGGEDGGAAYVIYGSAGGPSGIIDLSTADARLVGERAGDSAGCSAAGAADVNGDGLDDLMIGAYGNDAGGTISGAAYLIYGSPDMGGAYRLQP